MIDIRGIILVVVEIESEFINGEIHKPRGVNELVILEEFKSVKTDYGDKYSGKVQCNGNKPELKIYQMNNTSAKTAKKCFGPDTLQWINKRVAINFVPTAIRGEMVDVIYIDETRTIALNAKQTEIPTAPDNTVNTTVAAGTTATVTTSTPPTEGDRPTS